MFIDAVSILDFEIGTDVLNIKRLTNNVLENLFHIYVFTNIDGNFGFHRIDLGMPSTMASPILTQVISNLSTKREMEMLLRVNISAMIHKILYNTVIPKQVIRAIVREANENYETI